MRGSPTSRMASSMVVGSPSPIPAGVRVTKRESSLAERRGATSQVNQERPWLIATIFSLITKYQGRSEEHTSELQSRGHLVCRLLLEKKITIAICDDPST